ncbi:TerD family protein [Zymomonas mobilis]
MVFLLKGQTISLTKKDTKLRRIAFGVGWDAKKTRGFFPVYYLIIILI